MPGIVARSREAKRERRTSEAEGADWLDRYLEDSRHLAVSLFLVVPILLAYEVGLVLTRSQYQNAVDLVVKQPFHRFLGASGFLVFNALVLFGAGYLAGRLHGSRRLRLEVAVGAALEGLVYAILLGRGIAALLARAGLSIPAIDSPVALGIVLSLGAGVYEELFFRLALLETLDWILTRCVGLEAAAASALAIVLGSLAFAQAHYLGASPSATLDPYGFAFRFVAGLVLATIYRVRGLAVAVYTHAFYDCLLALS